MHIINELTEPAIIDFEIPSLSEIDLDKLYDTPQIEQAYNTLHVNPGRYTTSYGTKEYSELYDFLKAPLYEVIKKLLSLDKLRWPILDLGFKDFDEFYAKKAVKDQGLYVSVMTYKPGFSMPWHLDNRFAVLSGIINLNDHETQTCFSAKPLSWDHVTESPVADHTILHRGTKNKFQGTGWTNNELCWHSVPNVTVERKVILFGLNLR
jgi:hypothetical protein